MRTKMLLALLFLFIAGIGVYWVPHRPQSPHKAPPSAPAYDQYAYGRADGAKIIDFGTHPNAIFTSENLFHDRILQQQLAAEGWQLREHRYRNGIEMIPYTDGRLDVMVLGDIPAFIAMNQHRIGIFAVCRQGYNTVVANRRLTLSELKGLRVGYSPHTTAHFAIDRTLHSARLTMNDIISVPMTPDEMESAMRNRSVDAIVSWEPTASKILAIPGSFAISVSEGFVKVYSEPGQGTTFKIYLPRTQTESVTDTKEALQTPARGTETVLLVEDELSILKLGKSILERFGYTVLVASTPEEALTIAEAHLGTIHLLITDVVMPQMNGRDLMERVVALRPGMKTLYMSGYTADAIAHHGVLEKGIHFLQKPFANQALAAKVRQVLSGAIDT